MLTGEYCNGKSWNPIMKWFYDCPFKGKHHENGKWWCGIHAPSKVEDRRQARVDRKWDAKARKKMLAEKVAAARDEIASAAIEMEEVGAIHAQPLLLAIWAYQEAKKELEALDADG